MKRHEVRLPSRLGTASLLAIALTTPAVMVFFRPNGEPAATTHSPTLSLLESAIRRKGKLVASILSYATSVRASLPMTWALNSRLSDNATVMLLAPLMTWWLVKT